MTDDSSDVISSISGERMGEGSGKGGGTDLTQEAGNLEDMTEGLATDSGSGIRAILVGDRDRVISSGELMVKGGG